ncbi:MAG: hypothetical protein AAF485_13520, partial [Chloroflexota bacterium]
SEARGRSQPAPCPGCSRVSRGDPYPGLVSYFRASEPVFTVPIDSNGQILTVPTAESVVQWVEVYKSPAAQSASGAPKIEGVAQLLAYNTAGQRLAGQTDERNADAPLSSPNDVAATLYLRILGPLPDDTTISVALADSQQTWGLFETTAIHGEWLDGHIVEWQGVISLPPEMPFGDYRLWAALQFEEGPVIAEFAISEKDPLLTIEQP